MVPNCSADAVNHFPYSTDAYAAQAQSWRRLAGTLPPGRQSAPDQQEVSDDSRPLERGQPICEAGLSGLRSGARLQP